MEKAEMNVIRFGASDVVATSGPTLHSIIDDFTENAFQLKWIKDYVGGYGGQLGHHYSFDGMNENEAVILAASGSASVMMYDVDGNAINDQIIRYDTDPNTYQIIYTHSDNLKVVGSGAGSYLTYDYNDTTYSYFHYQFDEGNWAFHLQLCDADSHHSN